MSEPLTDDRLQSFRPVRIQKAADAVVDILVDAIRNGLFAPGERLPRERDLASRLEVSRTTVREAISILERGGVVRVRRGNRGGASVITRAIPPTLLERLHVSDRNIELRSLVEVRRPLELLAAALASERGTDETFDDLRQLTKQLYALTDSPIELMHLDYQIHLRIAEASGNPVLVAMLDSVLKRQAAVRFDYPVETFDPHLAITLHEKVLDALLDRDRAAVLGFVDEHLAHVEHHFFGERLPDRHSFISSDAMLQPKVKPSRD